MFHVVFATIIVAEREREIEAALRRRRLLQPQDEATEPATRERRTSDAPAWTPRARPTGG